MSHNNRIFDNNPPRTVAPQRSTTNLNGPSSTGGGRSANSNQSMI
jgi:hypothetical protein